MANQLFQPGETRRIGIERHVRTNQSFNKKKESPEEYGAKVKEAEDSKKKNNENFDMHFEI